MRPWTYVLTRFTRVSVSRRGECRLRGNRGPSLVAAASILACGIAQEPVDSERPTRDDARDADTSEVPRSRGADDRIGIPAPPFTVDGWIGSPPLTLAELRGKLVLVRFFTDGCPYCRATAPALAQLDADYRERGLVVIGLHHPKPRGARTSVATVTELVRGWGWTFPVGLDGSWTTLDAYWLGSGERSATSASFLVDREGVIRWVHPGPEFHPDGPADHEQCRRDYAQLRAAIDALLTE
jgi:thiol-disulfide isomerase/thioredoxin